MLWHQEPFSRLELILGNISFEKAEWDPRTASYQNAFTHYVEACARALLFSRSSFEAAKYVLRQRLLQLHPMIARSGSTRLPLHCSSRWVPHR